MCLNKGFDLELINILKDKCRSGTLTEDDLKALIN